MLVQSPPHSSPQHARLLCSPRTWLLQFCCPCCLTILCVVCADIGVPSIHFYGPCRGPVCCAPLRICSSLQVLVTKIGPSLRATCLSVSKNACLFCTTSFVDAYVDTQQLHATSLPGRLPTRLAVFDTDVMGLHGLKPLLSVQSQAAAFDIHMDTPDWPDGLIATSWHLWVPYTDLGFRVCSHYSQTQCGSLCERSQSNNISAPLDSIINSAHSCHLGFDHP